MIIASSIDKEAWKEVVNEFIRSELNSQSAADTTAPGRRDMMPPGTGREPLKVAYSLYSGQGAASSRCTVPCCVYRLTDFAMQTVQALVPPTPLAKMGEKLQPTALSHITPISANFSSPVTVPVDVLNKWPSTAAMLIPGPSVSECSAALLALGDCLLANHLVEAAHAWYVLQRVAQIHVVDLLSLSVATSLHRRVPSLEILVPPAVLRLLAQMAPRPPQTSMSATTRLCSRRSSSLLFLAQPPPRVKKHLMGSLICKHTNLSVQRA